MSVLAAAIIGGGDMLLAAVSRMFFGDIRRPASPDDLHLKSKS